MSQTVCILGRQPSLGLAELESLYGAEHVQPIGLQAVLLNTESTLVSINVLGGTLRTAKLLTFLPFSDWDSISNHLLSNLPKHLGFIPEGKIRLGLSVYGLRVNTKTINTTGLSLKKIIKATGRSVRVVPNTAPELNTAQVLHNQLAGPTGLELLIIADGHRTVLAQTTGVQNITAYAARDQQRPKRDARVGMLPPKLAQIILNLARPPAGSTVLDPFCGTGVLLQEALLMGYEAYGTDIDRRMFEYSQENMEWLMERFHPAQTKFRVSIGDATQTDWVQPIGAVATEIYLGRPFSEAPSPHVLDEVMRDVDTILRKFLKNLARQTPSGLPICLGVPAWKTQYGFQRLRTLDSLEHLGYTRKSFVHVGTDQLLYYRPDQVVARELVVLQRK